MWRSGTGRRGAVLIGEDARLPPPARHVAVKLVGRCAERRERFARRHGCWGGGGLGGYFLDRKFLGPRVEEKSRTERFERARSSTALADNETIKYRKKQLSRG